MQRYLVPGREGVGSLFRRTRFQINTMWAEKDSRPRLVAASPRYETQSTSVLGQEIPQVSVQVMPTLTIVVIVQMLLRSWRGGTAGP